MSDVNTTFSFDLPFVPAVEFAVIVTLFGFTLFIVGTETLNSVFFTGNDFLDVVLSKVTSVCKIIPFPLLVLYGMYFVTSVVILTFLSSFQDNVRSTSFETSFSFPLPST